MLADAGHLASCSSLVYCSCSSHSSSPKLDCSFVAGLVAEPAQTPLLSCRYSIVVGSRVRSCSRDARPGVSSELPGTCWPTGVAASPPARGASPWLFTLFTFLARLALTIPTHDPLELSGLPALRFSPNTRFCLQCRTADKNARTWAPASGS